MFHVVTGGSGSGKSAYAEEQICMLKKKTNSRHLYYIATMVPYGKETDTEDMRSSANAPQTEKMETDGVSEELLKTIGKLIIPVVIISLGGYLFVRKKKQPYT